MWLASLGQPELEILLVFCVGTLLMRSAGCAMNDYADRRFDAHVERTRARPLAAGEIRPREALAVAGALALAAFGFVLFLHPLAIKLSFVALAIAASYPYTKRFLHLPQAYLGVAFGFGIPMAYAAIQWRLPPICWWLLAANVFWAIAYDTEYAMVDREDDRRLGLRCIAAPIRNDEGIVVAGLSISAPTERHNSSWTDQLKRATASISASCETSQG